MASLTLDLTTSGSTDFYRYLFNLTYGQIDNVDMDKDYEDEDSDDEDGEDEEDGDDEEEDFEDSFLASTDYNLLNAKRQNKSFSFYNTEPNF